VQLSPDALQVLSQLCLIRDAFLFGSRSANTDTPFKLVSASLSRSVQRHIVDELLASGYLVGGDLGTAERNYACL